MARADAIAHIIDGQWPFLEQHCNAYQLRIFHAIRRCRTPALWEDTYTFVITVASGIIGTISRFHRDRLYRNRHCTQCQNTQKEQWIEARQQQFIVNRCPQCKTGNLFYLYPLDPVRGPPGTNNTATIDTPNRSGQ